ncbi:MAG TPA: flagellar biosynthesis anti-sigma factor FlgM [Allosphingosinicella sp.]|nr:flagellar biosynthesis anti-sigma factor FlgM [Allosphingosinicella sp.]
MDEISNTGRRHEGDGSAASSEGSDREARLAELRAAIQRGLDDIKADRVADPNEALTRIEKMLDELEAARSG